jgi:hypothetical protein
MFATTRSTSFTALAATLLLLAAPTIGSAADEIDWGFQLAFRTYVMGGAGSPPINATDGATCVVPNLARGGCDAMNGVSGPGVIRWTATRFTYDLGAGEAVIVGAGKADFWRPDHYLRLTIFDPTITIASDGTAVVNARWKYDSPLPPAVHIDARMDIATFDLAAAPVVTSQTVTWDFTNGRLTAAAAIPGLFPAGMLLDDMRIVLPYVVHARAASSSILLKDDPAKPEKRAVKLAVAKEPAVATDGDFYPTVNGVTVRVVSSTFDATYFLPPWKWIGILKKGVTVGYTYTDNKGEYGPITSVKILPGTLKIAGKGPALQHSLATEPDDVAIVLSSGIHSFCAAAGETSKTSFKAGKLFKASKNPAPAFCPAP